MAREPKKNKPSDPLLDRAASRMASAARSSGLPQDSLERFIRAGYVPQPKQLQFHAAARSCDLPDGPTQVGFGGARGPGKSHALFAQAALDDCQRVPGLKVLYLRKISRNAREQFDDLRMQVLRFVPHSYQREVGVLRFPNSSRIHLGHFKNESDIDQYLGLEYDLIVIEEATTLTLTKYRTLRDSNRTSKPNWRPRIYTSTNPGGVGHGWFKQMFIVPARQGHETNTRFIFATVDDNVFINREYKKNLEENTGWRLRAYRYGDWDIAAGQFFTTWSYDAHVIKPFSVPLHWPAWGAMDYGFTHPTVVYPFRENDGNIYVTGEYYAAKKLPVQHAPLIKGMFLRQGLDIARIKPFVAGADVFANKGDENAKTIAQQYAKFGIHLEQANMDRINGAGEILQLLGDVHDSERIIKPRLFIFDTCVRLIECLPIMQHDPHNPEDVLKVDVDEEGNGGDDPYDCLRYGVMTKRAPRSRPAVAGNRRSNAYQPIN
jgi:phage terminase large subunit